MVMEQGLINRSKANVGDDLHVITQSLQKAVLQGNVSQAQELVSILANRRANIEMHVQALDKSSATSVEVIRVKIHIEDKNKAWGTPVILKVKPSTTVKELKSMMVTRGFPREVQKWIIGKRFPSDMMSLSQCGVKVDGCSIFLYLMSWDAVGLTQDQCYQKYHNVPAFASYWQHRQANSQAEEPVYMSMHGTGNQGDGENQTRLAAPLVSEESEAIYEELHTITNPQPTQAALNLGVNNTNIGGRTTQPESEVYPGIKPPLPAHRPLTRLSQTQPRNQSTVSQPSPPKALTVEGWVCPACTYLNVATRPGCEMCSGGRPADYKVPDILNLPQSEQERIAREHDEDQKFREIEQSGISERDSEVSGEHDALAMLQAQLNSHLILNDMAHDNYDIPPDLLQQRQTQNVHDHHAPFNQTPQRLHNFDEVYYS